MRQRTPIGRRIREAAARKDMNMTQLAAAIGVRQANISYICTGMTKDPHVSTLVKIAKVTDVSLDWLLEPYCDMYEVADDHQLHATHP